MLRHTSNASPLTCQPGELDYSQGSKGSHMADKIAATKAALAPDPNNGCVVACQSKSMGFDDFMMIYNHHFLGWQ